MFMSIGWFRRFEELFAPLDPEEGFMLVKSMSDAPFKSLATSSSACKERSKNLSPGITDAGMRWLLNSRPGWCQQATDIGNSVGRVLGDEFHSLEHDARTWTANRDANRPSLSGVIQTNERSTARCNLREMAREARADVTVDADNEPCTQCNTYMEKAYLQIHAAARQRWLALIEMLIHSTNHRSSK